MAPYVLDAALSEKSEKDEFPHCCNDVYSKKQINNHTQIRNSEDITGFNDFRSSEYLLKKDKDFVCDNFLGPMPPVASAESEKIEESRAFQPSSPLQKNITYKASALSQTRDTGRRRSLARMAAAGCVQTNGSAALLCSLMYLRMAS